MIEKFKNQQKIISLFEVVRDIPYGDIGSRGAAKVLEKKKGTCSGKHLLLGKLYELMGVKVRYMMCFTKFNFLKYCFPQNIQRILEKNSIVDYHNYLKIFTTKWTDVDVTFDLYLKQFGFPVNASWDGLKNCKIGLKPIKIFQVDDLVAEKKKIISSLPKEKQEVRKLFLRKMNSWLNQIRSERYKIKV